MRTSRGLSDCLGLLGTLSLYGVASLRTLISSPLRTFHQAASRFILSSEDAANSPRSPEPNTSRSRQNMSNYEHITYEPRGAVALVTLNRPEKLNAWTPKMELEFIDAINSAAADGEIGCVVITGAGRGFCAGADIGNWDRGLKNGPPVRRSKMLNEGGSPEVPVALSLGKPTIAAINGVSVGVGLTMTLACDIRIASTAARFSARFVKVGLTPECGSTRYLPLVAGLPNALFLALTGRIIDAHEALQRRLVDRLVEPDQLVPAALKLAEEIDAKPREAV